MVHLRCASICVVVSLLLCCFTNNIECGRSGGGGGRGSSGRSSSSGGGSRGWSSGGWGSRSSSGTSSTSNRGSSSGYGSSSSSISLSPSRTSSSSSTGVSGGRITKPNSNTHSTSHVLPISTGARKPNTITENQNSYKPKVETAHEKVQQSSSQHSPSAPPMAGGGSFAPSAPPLPQGSNKPAPAPGWNVGNDANIRRDNVQGLNNQPGSGMHPPPYPGAPNHYPNAPPPYPGAPNHYPNAPPPYPGAPNHYPNAPPPPYPGAPNHYPNAPPPPYHAGVNNYPGPPLSGVPPPQYPGTHYSGGGGHHYSGGIGGNPHYPTQQGPPSYHPSPQYYPQSNNLPPPPPGYSPYGVPYYQKPSSGIKASHVMMGLALWQMTRPHHHHHFYGSGGYDSYNNPGYNYHEFNRQRYTTTYGSQNPNSNAPGASNTLEMTHYVVPDEKGAYKTVVGNMTCFSVYDAKAVSKWANRTMDDFYSKFPGSKFPLFETGKNDTNKYENFTMIPGRVIHEEMISVTCCGTDKSPLELSMLTSGKSPDVNCLHFIGKIPFRKLTFVKVSHVPAVNISAGDWQPIQLVEPNFNSTSTPTPLAPFPTKLNDSFSTTTPTVDLSQTFSPLGANNVTSTTSGDLKMSYADTSTTPSNEGVFPSLGNINSTAPSNEDVFPSLGSTTNSTVSNEGIFPSLGSTNSTTTPDENVTNNPSNIVIV